MPVAIVLAGGDPVEPEVKARLPHASIVVAADSGLHQARALGLPVDVIVGDFDSADPAVVREAVAAGARTETHPVGKDATDLELALDAAARVTGIDRIVVVGGGGGRLDHLLGNLLLLAADRYERFAIEAHLGTARVVVARGGRGPVPIMSGVGALVTLVPLAGAAHGIVTTGLAYPLSAETLDAGSTRGLSNVVAEAPASVVIEHGVVLVVEPDCRPEDVA